MSVNPGFGGQTFIARSVEKIRAVRALLAAAGQRAPIEVDGGIDLTTVPQVVAAARKCWSPATRYSAADSRRGRAHTAHGGRGGARPPHGAVMSERFG